MLQVAFAGTFAARLEQPARRHLAVPCEIIVSDEVGIIPRLGEVDVLVAMAFTDEIARAASRLKLVQVPGAGLDRIDRSALPDGVLLANAYGHETGIAEYVIGGIETTLPLHQRLVDDPEFRRGAYDIHWLERFLGRSTL